MRQVTRLASSAHRQSSQAAVAGCGTADAQHVLDKFQSFLPIDAIYVVTDHHYARTPGPLPFQGHFAGKPIHIVDDGTSSNEDRLGAIGDIGYVLRSYAIDDDLVVVAGDNLFSGTLTDFVQSAKQRGVLVGVYDGDLEQIRKYNNLGIADDGRITFFEEKPSQPISTVTAIALYHYPRTVLPYLHRYLAEGKNPNQPGRLVEWLYPQLPCYTYRISGIWLDIGSQNLPTRPSACFNRHKTHL